MYVFYFMHSDRSVNSVAHSRLFPQPVFPSTLFGKKLPVCQKKEEEDFCVPWVRPGHVMYVRSIGGKERGSRGIFAHFPKFFFV